MVTKLHRFLELNSGGVPTKILIYKIKIKRIIPTESSSKIYKNDCIKQFIPYVGTAKTAKSNVYFVSNHSCWNATITEYFIFHFCFVFHLKVFSC